jgi:thioredoxin-dependent peroxiredoxin
LTDPPAHRQLRVGDALPEFAGTTDSGGSVSRSDLLGRPAVVFFYPKAGSPGCSIESREFARRHGDFAAAGATIVGVSVDPAEAQQRFRESCGLPFRLLADADGTISRRFGVLGALRLARRTTFVIAPDGSIVDVIRTWRPGRHAELALERVRRLRAPPGGAFPERPGAAP